MSNDPKVERVLARFEPGRREALRKIAVGSAVYVAPVVASFSMDSLGGVAQAQAGNQVAVPATSGWSIAAMFGALTAAAAVLLRRRRDPK
jgi:MYXO-CTERM domain-containing protein